MNKTNHYKGKENPHYKYGAGEFVRKRAEIKAKIGKCERCGKDLTNAGHYEWVVHHKNHNHYDNSEGNYELLCKRCHQLEHKCTNNIPKTYEKVCLLCGETYTAKAHNQKYCPECMKVQRNMRRYRSFEQIKAYILQNKV